MCVLLLQLVKRQVAHLMRAMYGIHVSQRRAKVYDLATKEPVRLSTTARTQHPAARPHLVLVLQIAAHPSRGHCIQVALAGGLGLGLGLRCHLLLVEPGTLVNEVHWQEVRAWRGGLRDVIKPACVRRSKWRAKVRITEKPTKVGERQGRGGRAGCVPSLARISALT